MNKLQIFNNDEFGQIRAITIDKEPWFIGKDAALALGYKDTSDALKKHVDSEDKLTRRFADSGQSREMYIINESGLYSLIFGSKLESAKRFKRWVTSEVLPAIRKTGSYKGKVYRIQDASLSEVTALLHECSSFLREMDKVMREQNSHPSDIAQEFKSVCEQLGIVKLSDDFVKAPYVFSEFLPLSAITAED